MSVNAAIISAIPQTTIKFTSKGRKVDLEGYEVADNEALSFQAGVLPSGSKFKKGDPNGSVGVDDNMLFACGKVDVQLDDELEFCGNKSKVVDVTFWAIGGYTQIITRLLSRKAVTYG